MGWENAPVRVTKGPAIGVPPTLEWIAVERLNIDTAYQRATEGAHSRRIIAGMVKCWDWRLCQPLNVSRRSDGSLFVVDGQHRLLGARQRGDVPHLPCVVGEHSDSGDEANTFVALNQKRQRLSQGDVFNAALAAGDADAKRVLELASRAGLSFARHGNPVSWTPDQIFCGPALVKAIKQHGDAVIANALVAIAEAYQGKVKTHAATVLKALLLIYSDDANRPGFDPDLFIEALGRVEMDMWNDLAREARRANPALSGRESMALAMMDQYDAVRAERGQA
jgi:hypothetical protein